MKVRDLLKVLYGADLDAVVLTPTHDHGYCEAAVSIGSALEEARGVWTEDHGEEVTPEAQYGRRVPAVIVT